MTTVLGRGMPSQDQQGDGTLGRIALPVAGGLEIVPAMGIDWLESEGNYVHVYVDGCPRIVRATLRGFASRLDRALFRQIHRSTIVNLSRIVGFRAGVNGDGTIVLAGGQTLRLSRRFRQSLLEVLRRSPRIPNDIPNDTSLRVSSAQGVG